MAGFRIADELGRKIWTSRVIEGTMVEVNRARWALVYGVCGSGAVLRSSTAMGMKEVGMTVNEQH